MFITLTPGAVKEAIHTVLNESLGGKSYEHDKVSFGTSYTDMSVFPTSICRYRKQSKM